MAGRKGDEQKELPFVTEQIVRQSSIKRRLWKVVKAVTLAVQRESVLSLCFLTRE